MDWFKRKKRISTIEKKTLPDGLWIKCDRCGEIIYRSQLLNRMNVCPKCDFHFRVTSQEYIKYLFDENSFEEFNQYITPGDPLNFKDTKKYIIVGHAVVGAIMDFTFIGGSMGSVVGEKIARAIDRAREERKPLIIVSASGGARMMEAALSLMQMAKTSAKLSQLSDAGVPFISILTDPTTGGTTASFAMLGDIHIAEPGALIGFAGQRVIKQTIGQDLPEGFQRAEFLQEHGFVDIIVHRMEMRKTVGRILDLLWPKDEETQEKSAEAL